MKNNVVIAFLAEFFQRLGAKNPIFFTIIAWISTILTIVTGVPELLDMLGITLSPFLQSLENKTLAICGIIATIIANLPVQQPKSNALGFIPGKKTEDLPFTQQAELKQAAKETAKGN